MRRPLVWAAGAFAAGTCLAGWGFLPGLAAPLILFGLAIAAACTPRRRQWRERLCIVLAFAAAGSLLWNARHTGDVLDPLGAYARDHPRERCQLEGWVRRSDVCLPEDGYTSFVVEADQVRLPSGTLPITGRTQARWPNPGLTIHPGQRIRLTGRLDPYIGYVNRGTRSVEALLRGRGIHSLIRVEEDGVEVLDRCWWSPPYWASRLRHWEARLLTRAIPDDALPFVLTVWLGARNRIDEADYDRYLRSGTAHILAVSGVHTGIVYLALSFLLRGTPLSRRKRILTIMAGVFVFALVAGARISSLRAAVMIALYLTADLFDREPDAPTALSIAALLFLLHNPNAIFATDFLLSFSSVASILIYAERIGAVLAAAPRWLRLPLNTSLSVQILPLPLAIHFFHVLPVLGPAVNLLVIPLLTGILSICFMTVVAGAIAPPLAVLFGHALYPLFLGIEGITRLAANLPGLHPTVVSPTQVAAACYGFGCLSLAIALTWDTRWRRWLATAAACVLVAGITWQPWRPQATVDFLDVGHADAAFVRTPGGSTVLIDGGALSDYMDTGKRVVAPFLLSNGIDQIDYVIATHPERDHLGGLLYIIDHFPVGEALLGPATDHPLETDFLHRCEVRGVPVRRLCRGDKIDVKGASLEVLHPPPGYRAKGYNEHSLVMRLAWPGLSVLFAGDVETGGEGLLAAHDCLAGVLKVPHHGSATSSTAAFLDAVRPQDAVISTRETHHPATGKGVLERYRDRGIRVWRTDHHGGIRIRRHEDTCRFQGARLKRGYSLEPQ